MITPQTRTLSYNSEKEKKMEDPYKIYFSTVISLQMKKWQMLTKLNRLIRLVTLLQPICKEDQEVDFPHTFWRAGYILSQCHKFRKTAETIMHYDKSLPHLLLV